MEIIPEGILDLYDQEHPRAIQNNLEKPFLASRCPIRPVGHRKLLYLTQASSRHNIKNPNTDRRRL
jgi:hypothetical protein